ncbi:MAG: hypothetical protein HYV13_04155 [Candidatus Doudnabacteria bacterium]|nr:hypothetical protein [Candidatus Doudnabacteria bacterium]
MTKISRIKLPREQLSLLIDQLWRAFTLLETKDEVHKFLHDILTRTELQMLSKRLEIVKMLNEGCSYAIIKNTLKVTDSTIAKISNWNDAFGDGYKLVIDRLVSGEKSRKNKSWLVKPRPMPSSRRAAML